MVAILFRPEYIDIMRHAEMRLLIATSIFKNNYSLNISDYFLLQKGISIAWNPTDDPSSLVFGTEWIANHCILKSWGLDLIIILHERATYILWDFTYELISPLWNRSPVPMNEVQHWCNHWLPQKKWQMRFKDKTRSGLFGTIPFPGSMLLYCQLDPMKQTS